MGRDKAALLTGGETWLEHLAAEALATGERVVVVGRPRPSGWPYETVELLLDDEPNQGPLGGLVTALRYADNEVLLVACDMPLVDRSAFHWLIAAAASHPGRPVVAAERGGRAEPLFSVYRPSVLGEAVERLARGERAMYRLLAALDARLVAAPDSIAAQLGNINDPDDLHRAGLDVDDR